MIPIGHRFFTMNNTTGEKGQKEFELALKNWQDKRTKYRWLDYLTVGVAVVIFVLGFANLIAGLNGYLGISNMTHIAFSSESKDPIDAWANILALGVFGAILCIVPGVYIQYKIGGEPEGYLIQKTPIKSLQLGKAIKGSISGSFFLGSGRVEGKETTTERFYFYEETKARLILRWLDAEKTLLVEGTGEPELWSFEPYGGLDERKQELHVPIGTVTVNYNADLDNLV
jgi:hypothetical protein